ncbi:hypothetical protein RJ639_032166, partial [Escallonia herrerae]
MGVLKEKQKSGIGGLIRDDKGQWLGGFYSSLPNCESLEGKLHGILKALQIIEDRDLHAASVETGSLIADQLLTNRQVVSLHPMNNLIKDNCFLLFATNSKILDELREDNQCTEKVSKTVTPQQKIKTRLSFSFYDDSNNR